MMIMQREHIQRKREERVVAFYKMDSEKFDSIDINAWKSHFKLNSIHFLERQVQFGLVFFIRHFPTIPLILMLKNKQTLNRCISMQLILRCTM